MHFWLNDINRTCARVAVQVFCCALEIVQRDRDGDDRIKNTFKNFVALTIQNGRVGHQMADVAQKQKRATVQSHYAILGLQRADTRLIFTVSVECAVEGFAVFSDTFNQRAFEDTQPVGIG